MRPLALGDRQAEEAGGAAAELEETTNSSKDNEQGEWVSQEYDGNIVEEIDDGLPQQSNARLDSFPRRDSSSTWGQLSPPAATSQHPTTGDPGQEGDSEPLPTLVKKAPSLH